MKFHPVSSLLVAILATISGLAGQRPSAPPKVTFTGRLIDPAGSPIPGARIAASWDEPPLTSRARELTGPDGSFRLTTKNPTPGSHGLYPRLLVTAPGRVSYLTRSAKDWMPESLELGTIALARAAVLAGQVRDAEGKPIAGARVTGEDLLPGTPFLTPHDPIALYGAALTDVRGAFRLPGMHRSAVQVTASKHGFYDGNLRPVQIGSPLTISLRPSPEVECQFLDVNGEAQREVVIVATYLGTRQHILRTGTDGSVTFTPRIAGPITLSTWLSTTGTRTYLQTARYTGANLTLRESMRAPQRRDPTPTWKCSVSGLVIDQATGQPLPGAKVWTRLVQGSGASGAGTVRHRIPEEAVTTDDKGRFRIAGLTPGHRAVFTTAPGRPVSPPQLVNNFYTWEGQRLVLESLTGERVHGRIVGRSDLSRLRIEAEVNEYTPGSGLARHCLHADLTKKGAFKFPPLIKIKHQAFLSVPTHPRCPQRVRIALPTPLEPGSNTIDGAKHRPSRIHGQIAIKLRGVDPRQFVAFATHRLDSNTAAGRGYAANLSNLGISPVDASGEFSMLVAPGEYHLHVHDLRTGLALRPAERITIERGKDLNRSFSLDLVDVELEFADRFHAYWVNQPRKRRRLRDWHQTASLLGPRATTIPGDRQTVRVALPIGKLEVYALSDGKRHGKTIEVKPATGDHTNRFEIRRLR